LAWPEELHDQLGEGFPPPRAGEPESLRRDIADELSDHLACSLEREMWHTKDEAAARRAVLGRFGDPRWVAAKLWWDAMKGTIMKDRILMGAVVVLALACLAALGFGWMALEQSRAFNQAMLARLEKLGASPAPALPVDRGSLHVRLVEGTPAGKPVAGLNLTLKGNPFNESKEEQIDIRTGADGTATIGPIRAGEYRLICSNEHHMEKYVTLYGGQVHEETIVCPEGLNAPPRDLSFKIDWPKDFALLKQPRWNVIVCEFKRDPPSLNLNGTNWEGGFETRKLDDKGRVLRDFTLSRNEDSVSGPASPLKDPLKFEPMPAGHYRLFRLHLFTSPELKDTFSNPFTVDFGAGNGPRFEVSPTGDNQQWTIELPQEMMNEIDAAFGAPAKIFDLKKGEIGRFGDFIFRLTHVGVHLSNHEVDSRFFDPVTIAGRNPLWVWDQCPVTKEPYLCGNYQITLESAQPIPNGQGNGIARIRVAYAPKPAPTPAAPQASAAPARH